MIFIKIITPFRHPDLCGAEDEESRADEDADEGRDAKFAEGVDEATGGAGGIPSVEITSSLWVDEAAL